MVVRESFVGEMDLKVPVRKLRLSRRWHESEGPHSWKKDYGEAERIFQARKKQREAQLYNPYRKTPKNESQGNYISSIVKTVDPDDLGTNAILEEFGMKPKKIDEAFAIYKKEVIKPASRIAVAYARVHGVRDIRQELPHLFELVYLLGKDAVFDMAVERGMKPSEIMRGKAMEQLLNYMAARHAVPSLEIIASSVPVPQMYKTERAYAIK